MAHSSHLLSLKLLSPARAPWADSSWNQNERKCNYDVISDVCELLAACDFWCWSGSERSTAAAALCWCEDESSDHLSTFGPTSKWELAESLLLESDVFLLLCFIILLYHNIQRILYPNLENGLLFPVEHPGYKKRRGALMLLTTPHPCRVILVKI